MEVYFKKLYFGVTIIFKCYKFILLFFKNYILLEKLKENYYDEQK
jgi:hypothetical protein